MGVEIERIVAQRVKRLREAHGLSQAAFAKKAGISQRAVSGLERHIYAPSITTLIKIASAFQVSASSLFEDIRPKSRKDDALAMLGAYAAERSESEIEALLRVARAMFESPRRRQRG